MPLESESNTVPVPYASCREDTENSLNDDVRADVMMMNVVMVMVMRLMRNYHNFIYYYYHYSERAWSNTS